MALFRHLGARVCDRYQPQSHFYAVRARRGRNALPLLFSLLRQPLNQREQDCRNMAKRRIPSRIHKVLQVYCVSATRAKTFGLAAWRINRPGA